MLHFALAYTTYVLTDTAFMVQLVDCFSYMELMI